MRGEIDVSYHRDGLAVAGFDAVVITLVRSAVTSEFLEASFLAMQRRALRHRAGVTSLTLLSAGTPIPDGAMREESARYTREAAPWVRAGATVVWGQGFAAATIRSVIIAMTLLTSGPPRRIFGAPTDAVGWLEQRAETSAGALTPIVSWSERALSDDYLTLFS